MVQFIPGGQRMRQLLNSIRQELNTEQIKIRAKLELIKELDKRINEDEKEKANTQAYRAKQRRAY